MNLLAATVHGARLQGLGWSVMFDDRRAAILAERQGTTVIAGIRPEHIALRTIDESGEAIGKIIYREPRGDTDVMTINLGKGDDAGVLIVAEAPGPSAWRVGDGVGLDLAVDQMHVFEDESGRNLEVGS
jgi:ABC-type sugar transport system ATPase subunit